MDTCQKGLAQTNMTYPKWTYVYPDDDCKPEFGTTFLVTQHSQLDTPPQRQTATLLLNKEGEECGRADSPVSHHHRHDKLVV